MSAFSRKSAILGTILAALALVWCLYFFALSGFGLVSNDEPRYASIGREMAESGDWITPRLWGAPWFEKPPLLYWMIGAAHKAGLGDELAARLPIALASAAFLCFYCRMLAREIGLRAAAFSTALLATSAGWMAYSHIGVTDLPMTAAFAAALLLSPAWTTRPSWLAIVASGFLIGLAVLAKGLVPLVLALPAVWLSRREWKRLALGFAVFLVTAAPWYTLMVLRHGKPFLEEFFWKHHFQRYATGVLRHEQPFWYYAPVLIAAILPWSPAIALLFRKSLYADARSRFLFLWLAFGFVFFSFSRNKLPGYLLPLLPAACALLGLALAETKSARVVLALSALLAGTVLFVAVVLPDALTSGLSDAPLAAVHWTFAAPGLLLAGAVWWLESAKRRTLALALATVGAVSGVTWLKWNVAPALDNDVSARGFWREIAAESDQICIERLQRAWRYGLNYYSRLPLPDCGPDPRPLRVTQEGDERPTLERPLAP